MAIGRSRYAPPYASGTKGHSVLKQRSYAMPTRNPPSSSVSRMPSAAYDTRAEEYMLADRVSNVNYLSNTLMDEGYDTALKSRGRDQQLLKEATNAIVSSESYATPQTSVASRRVARGQTVVPRAASVPPRSLRPEHKSSSHVKVSRKVQQEDDDQPRTLMSWKYRLDSMMSPSDLLYKPSSLIRIREQVKDAQEKMSRHREMLDKYLPEEGESGDVAMSIRRKMAAMERRDPVGLRRRERKVQEEQTTTTASED